MSVTRVPASAFLLLGALPLLLPAAPARAEDAFRAAKARYEAYLERPSLYMRHRGRERFARTKDPRALAILARSYARPEEPREQNRYLLAALCADAFDDPAHVPALRAWRAKHAKARDLWLWHRTLAVEWKHAGPVEVIAALHGNRPAPLRASALLTLAQAGDENTLPNLLRLLDDLPARPFDRALLLEAAAESLDLLRKHMRSKPWRDVAARLIPFLDERATQPRTRLVLARRFARIWRTRERFVEAAPWLARLAGAEPAPTPGEGERYAAPKVPFFLGLEGTGRRVAYVIDLSDSMLTPLTGKEIEDLKRTPARPRPARPVVTGGAAKDGKKSPGRPDPGPDVPLVQLPWANIRTRFDAAREFLKLSLQGLGPEHHFCVIGFGSEAAPLAATPGLRRASPANVEKAIRELDAIEPGARTKGRPYGTLRGYTNLHGGLRRAFLLRPRGLLKRDADVDPDVFEDGCDTIFLLSDGKPTWDDWPTKDTLDPDNEPGDPEFGATTRDSKTATFYGPYAVASRLLDDLRRLELLRHVEIHCIGLGEYDPRLLDVIARIGKGRFRRVGAGS